MSCLRCNLESWLRGACYIFERNTSSIHKITLERVGEGSISRRWSVRCHLLTEMWNSATLKHSLKPWPWWITRRVDSFNLEDVIKRTTANPETAALKWWCARGFEELAQDLGYTALFITWRQAEQYHRVSKKWNGASIKDGHQVLMQQWALGRALIAKEDIQLFRFRGWTT